jgi:hypothetical protein
MKEKLIAGLLAALTTLTTVYPVLAAGTLGDFPGFLGLPGAGFLLVVGSTADPSDVVGAADAAIALAVQSTTQQSTSGTTAATGIEKDTTTINYGLLTTEFPNPIRTAHYNGLKQGYVSWKGNSYDYHEQINISVDATNTVFFSHANEANINGTEKMVVYASRIAYEYVFDKALNLSTATTAATTGTLLSPEYTNPIKVKLLGKEFVIVGIGSGQIKMLSGSAGMATATEGVVYGDYTVYPTLGGTTFVQFKVVDKAGTTVETGLISSVPNEVITTKTTPILTIKATSVSALQDGTVAGAYLVVGEQGAVEKTYDSSCDVTGTGVTDKKFPGSDSWCIQAVGFATAGQASVGDKIMVVYKPQTSPQYFVAGTKLSLPNDYGELGYRGWNYDTWTTLTVSAVTSQSLYHSPTSIGTTNTTTIATGLNGIEIVSAPVASIVDPNSNTAFLKAYILFGLKNSTTIGGNSPVYIGFWDSVNQRIGGFYNANGNGTYMKYINDTLGVAGACGVGGAAGPCGFAFNFTISYGGGAASVDLQYLYVNVSILEAGSESVAVVTGKSLFTNFRLGTAALPSAIVMNFFNKTATWTITSLPEFRLYSTDSAEAKDMTVRATDTSGVAQAADIGLFTQDFVTDSGATVVAPTSNAGSQRVVVKVPSQVLKIKAYVGKLGGTVTTGGTYLTYTPVTVPVAKLDTELTASDKLKNLVVIGGSCKNREAALALGLTFPTCGAASTVPQGAALIKVVADYPATGKYTVLVAGWEAAQTRTACSVIQQYATLLAGQNASVKVTAATAAGITAL